MNILFMLGNGFDLNLGLKTSYTDFYKEYTKQEPKSDAIAKLKQNIKTGIENWSDLELALGQYTKNIHSTEEFDEIFEDLSDSLANYLDLQQKSLSSKFIDKTKMLNDLVSPESVLPATDKQKIMKFKNKFKDNWKINVVTFNYTQSFEIALGDDAEKTTNLGKNNSGYNISLDTVKHLHGYTNKRMVMGVNDLSQVANSKLHNNIDIIETIIKPQCNQANKHTLDTYCEHLISTAHLICIFGSSIGSTDNYWWNIIGQRLKADTKLIIFHHGKKIPARREQLKARVEREIKEQFLKKIQTENNEDKRNIAEKIIVGVNTSLFDIKKKTALELGLQPR